MSNLIRRKFGDEQLTKEEAVRLAVLKHHKFEELDLHIGDMFFYDHQVVRVTGFKIEKYKHHQHEITNPRIYIEYYSINARTWYKRTGGYEYVSEYSKPTGPKLTKDPETYLAEALKAIETGDISKYKFQQTQSEEDETGLMHVGSKESLEAVKGDLESKVNQIEIITGFMHLEMERRRMEIEMVKRSLEAQVALFEKKIEKLYKVILTIELFLGVKEHIIQLQEGNPAAPDSPICVRQTIYYMDEEVGDPGSDLQGLEFKSIKDFDTWVVKDKNYIKLVPESKGIIALQVRRNKKEREIDNPYVRMLIEIKDTYTYLLLRNGDNVYRLGTDKLEFRPRLFPNRKELQSLKDIWDKVESKGSDKLTEKQSLALKDSEIYSKWSSFTDGELKESIEDSVMRYKMKFTVLQGLIMRTAIFHPLSKPISFFTAKAQEDDLVRLIYDDELTLPTGRLSFHDWLSQLNEKIQEGSRIVLGWTHKGRSKVRDEKVRHYYSIERPGRFDDRYRGRGGRNEWINTPKEPGNGLYYLSSTIRNVRVQPTEADKWRMEDMKFLCIKYNPGGEVINYWDRWDDGHERKNNISYIIFKEDEFIINYDDVKLEDIDFYLNSRIDRRNYLYIMPLLWQVKIEKEKEREQEKDFVTLVIGELIKLYGDKVSGSDVLKRRHVWDAIEWWKAKKVKWKRPIKQDEAKALRMIIKRLENQLKLN
jgi:hypothetical protein